MTDSTDGFEGTNINPSSWFSMIMGMSESDWIKSNCVNIPAGAGTFSIYSINELRENLKIVGNNIPIVNIYSRSKNNSIQYFDTSYLQCHTKVSNSDVPVMYQVASNFNCLEGGSHLTNHFDGSHLTDLMSDATQGPSASAGAGCGAILRLQTQFQKQQLNLLDDLDFNVINGKVINNNFSEKSDINCIKVGLHCNVMANFERIRSSNGKMKCIYYKDAPLIDQVFTSSIPLMRHQSAQDLKACRFLLKGAYTGTYLCAIKQKTRKLVLTLIGGGVFNNPYSEIINAIVQTHINLSKYSELEEVDIPLYAPNADYEFIAKQFIENGYPKDKIKYHLF